MSSAFCWNSARWTRNWSAWFCRAARSGVPAFGNGRFVDLYDFCAWFISASNCVFVIFTLPTAATSPLPTVAEEPPQPAATRPRARTARRGRNRLNIGKRGRRGASRRLAGLQDSIDQPESFLESVLAPERHLALRRRVDRGVEAAAQPAQLVRAEHERPDGRTAAAEDEVVRPGERE